MLLTAYAILKIHYDFVYSTTLKVFVGFEQASIGDDDSD